MNRRLPAVLSCAMLACLLTVALARPAAAVSIGLVAPQSGPFAILGRQMRAGAEAAALAKDIDLVMVDEPCTEGSGAAIADQLRAARVDGAIGFLCSESLDGALQTLADANIPAITLSVRGTTIMEDALRKQWPLFRLAPSNRAEAETVIDVILTQWVGSAFALVDDGTIRSRELIDAIRAPLEEKGMKPVIAESYRPGQDQQIALIRRLKKAGVSRVFVTGDRSDVAILARDARSENAGLRFLGGEALNAVDGAVALPDGVQAVLPPDYAPLPSAKAAVTAIRARSSDADGYALPAYAAVELLNAAAGAGGPMPTALAKTEVESAIGPLRFRPDHERADNPYALLEWQDNRFRPVRPSKP